jgi:hypothetical protein
MAGTPRISGKIAVLILVLLCRMLPAASCPAAEAHRVEQFGMGFLEVYASGLRVLHLKGTAYERGYQRGMLQDDLAYVTTTNITESMVWLGGDDPQAGLEILQDATRKMEPFMPYRFREEMQGMADALAAQGSLVTYDDILLHVVGADLGMMDLGHDLDLSPTRSSFPDLSRCSSFSAWGDATRDGHMIMAGNSDYYDTAEELGKRSIAVVHPTDGGHGYVAALWDVFYSASGVNEAGIGVHGHLVSSDSESLLGVSAELLLGLVLQDADSIEDAVEILAAYPRTNGIIVHVSDAEASRSAMIEYTADDIAVRFSDPADDMIWTTNHFNCYPGWQGYSGLNMAPAQDQRGGLVDIRSVEKWQDSLEEKGKGRAGRYGRYGDLLADNYGEIDPDIAMSIVGDRYSRARQRILDPTEVTDWGDYPIMVCRPDWVMSESIDYYKGGSRAPLVVKSGTVSSFVATPGTGDTWWTVGIPPSGCTMVYTHLNLHEELARSR